MRRSRKINPSLPITLLTKSLTLTSDMMARQSLVIEVYKHSFHKVSLLTLESAIRSLKKFKMYQLQKLELLPEESETGEPFKKAMMTMPGIRMVYQMLNQSMITNIKKYCIKTFLQQTY